jgi:hypothetical protein
MPSQRRNVTDESSPNKPGKGRKDSPAAIVSSLLQIFSCKTNVANPFLHHVTTLLPDLAKLLVRLVQTLTTDPISRNDRVNAALHLTSRNATTDQRACMNCKESTPTEARNAKGSMVTTTCSGGGPAQALGGRVCGMKDCDEVLGVLG